MCLAAQFLGERAAHEEIAQVDDQTGGHHFEHPCLGGNEEKGGKFSGRGDHSCGHQKGLKSSQSDVSGFNSQSKGNGKIPHTDGNTISQAFQSPGPPSMGMGVFHSDWQITLRIVLRIIWQVILKIIMN